MELLRVLLAVSVIWSLVQLSSSNTECPDPNPNAGYWSFQSCHISQAVVDSQ